jgi:hypothetical protein
MSGALKGRLDLLRLKRAEGVEDENRDEDSRAQHGDYRTISHRRPEPLFNEQLIS